MKEDKTLTCCECGNEFTFTASEQEFYAEKGFTNEPRRCSAKCSPLLALSAAKKPWFLSNRLTIVRYTAANASTVISTN